MAGSISPQGPQSPQRPQRQRRTSSRAFSLSSHKSSDSKDKIQLTESAKEKAAGHLHTKADPNMAVGEAQPCELAVLCFG